MKFQGNNQFWKNRTSHGRDKLFNSPELLWEEACNYFQWCDDNPWIKTENTTTEKGFITKEIPTQRPYSKKGLYVYFECSDSWLKEFKKVCNSDFLLVIEKIENIIESQQWEGATVGAFNSNIIARTLGLKEQTDVTTDGEKIQSSNIIVEIVKPKEDE